jgi:hypothetical protein
MFTSSRHFVEPTQPPAQCVKWSFCPTIERLCRETGLSSEINAENLNTWIYISTA